MAGNWARQEPYAYNPSYPSPVAFDLLHQASGDPRWIELAAGSRAATERFPRPRSACPRTGPRWTAEEEFGPPQERQGTAAREFGTATTPPGCRCVMPNRAPSDDVALAARLSAPLSRAPRHAAVRNLDGEPIGTDESVVAMAGLAAVYAASGDRNGSAAALVAADQVQQQHPSYYGAAWNALGRLMLTDRTLGGCPPLT